METHKKDCEHGKRQREIELKAAEELERKKQQEGEDFFAEFVDGLEEFEGQYLSLLDNAPNYLVGCVIQKRFKVCQTLFVHYIK